MYISLRESGTTGFKKWSASHQPKTVGNNSEDAENSSLSPDPSVDASRVTLPALPLVLAEGSL
jgi:hypothetical protein